MSTAPNETLIHTAQSVGDDLGYAWGTRVDQDRRAAVMNVDAAGGDATQRLSTILQAANAADQQITEATFWREMFVRSVTDQGHAPSVRMHVEQAMCDAFVASLKKYNA